MFNSSKCLIQLPHLFFFSQNLLISTKNLSGAAIVIFRRCLTNEGTNMLSNNFLQYLKNVPLGNDNRIFTD